eukprot:TRINITY_DN4019_c0_g1_i1.p1 TRINITY_DN4019_c0_g1~~TRINITY_DN4019_c0_g1_i1.p1  ORF type:complete len:357 (+),score=50.73 TRINITY_DN4019_c0_g1_i1:92-1162(+)
MQSSFTKSKFPYIVFLLFPWKWLLFWITRTIMNSFFPNLQSNQPQARVVIKGLIFGEGPRIHNSKLYFSDFYAQKITVVDTNTEKVDNIITLKDDMPSGLGWLPDGRMLIVKMNQMKLVVYDEKNDLFEDYADLQKFSRFRCNDMVVDKFGRAYVGNFGFDVDKFLQTFGGSVTTSLVQVDENKQVRLAATDLFFPNGLVITPDGGTMLVCETVGGQISAFDVDVKNGYLSNRRVWAKMGVPVDGMCLDAEGCVWVAVPQIGIYNTPGAVVRVGPDGNILQVLGFGGNGIKTKVYACMLHTIPHTNKHVLYVVTGKTSIEHTTRKYGTKNGKILVFEVDVGPALQPDSPHYNAGYC